jgi:replication factor C subunit 1
MNVFRAVMITGPPGIGKTTSAHLCAKLAGFTPIEVNASDSRSKKLVEVQYFILFAVVGVLIN